MRTLDADLHDLDRSILSACVKLRGGGFSPYVGDVSRFNEEAAVEFAGLLLWEIAVRDYLMRTPFGRRHHELVKWCEVQTDCRAKRSYRLCARCAALRRWHGADAAARNIGVPNLVPTNANPEVDEKRRKAHRVWYDEPGNQALVAGKMAEQNADEAFTRKRLEGLRAWHAANKETTRGWAVKLNAARQSRKSNT